MFCSCFQKVENRRIHDDATGDQNNVDEEYSQKKNGNNAVNFSMVVLDQVEEVVEPSFNKHPLSQAKSQILLNFISKQYLGMNKPVEFLDNSVGVYIVPGLSDPENISFQHMHEKGMYLAFSGDQKHKDLRFIHINVNASLKRKQNATFEPISCGIKNENDAYRFRCMSFKEKPNYITFDDCELILSALTEESDSRYFNTIFILKPVKKNHNLAIHKKSIKPLVPVRPEEPSPPQFTNLNFKKSNSKIDNKNITYRLPSHGVAKNRLCNKQTGASLYLSLQGTLESKNDSAAFRVITGALFNRIEVVKHCGKFLAYKEPIENASCLFSLKGNINFDHTQWKMHENRFNEHFFAFEAFSDNKPCGLYMVYNSSTNKITLEGIPKKLTKNKFQNWKERASWYICANRQIGIEIIKLSKDGTRRSIFS